MYVEVSEPPLELSGVSVSGIDYSWMRFGFWTCQVRWRRKGEKEREGVLVRTGVVDGNVTQCEIERERVREGGRER